MTIGMRKLPEVVLRITEILVLDPLSRWWARLSLYLWGAKVGKGFKVRGRIRLRLQGDVRIGNHVRLRSGYSNYVGASEPMAIFVFAGGMLKIGDHCGLSNSTIVCQQQIEILDGTWVGGGCKIYDTDFHQLNAMARLADQGPVTVAPIRIGPRAFVGSHCTVLKGVTIGEKARSSAPAAW